MIRDAERQASIEHRRRDRLRKNWRRRPYTGDGSAPYWGSLEEFDLIIAAGICLHGWATERPCARKAEAGSRLCSSHRQVLPTEED